MKETGQKGNKKKESGIRSGWQRTAGEKQGGAPGAGWGGGSRRKICSKHRSISPRKAAQASGAPTHPVLSKCT